MRRLHVIVMNPDYDQWEPASGGAYEHWTCPERPGSLYQLIELKKGIGTAHEYREDVLAVLSGCATVTEARVALDDFSAMDVTEGDGGGHVYDSETWNEIRDDFEAGYPDNSCEGAIRSRLDPYNAYTPDGEKCGRLCQCEDYPCCGH